MSDKYRNDKGVYFDAHTDNRGRDHIDIYDNNPREEHTSIHINWDSDAGKGNIRDTTDGDERTDVSCYLTTACMKHFNKSFNDDCYELTVLRWFRDNFVYCTLL